MAENITQCPKCNTSFRISDAHLNTAKGSVRCGSCLHVFNARNFLIESQEAVTAPVLNKKETSDKDVLISDYIDDPNADDPFGIGTQYSEEFSQAVAKSDTGEYEFNLFERDKAEDDGEQENQDESWVLDLLDEDNEEKEHKAPSTEPTHQEIEEYAEQEEPHITEEFENSYYNNSFQIIDEKPTDQKDMEALFQDEYEEEPFEEIDYADTAQAPEASPSNSNYLDAIEPEPVEFDWQGHTSFWQSKTLWTILSLFAGAVLTLQIAWINFDKLSVMKPYRAYYAKGCEVFGCKLPDLIDRSKIKTANLVIRSHPQLKNALIVDAVLQNNAVFEQTFPVLDLIFTDKQNKIIAVRRLTPADYLAGELAGRSHMPIRQPLHITIEIADPGKDATGYKISIAN